MPSARASPGESIWTGRPSRRISPPSPRKAPVRILISVDLPAPFSPRRAWISPASTRRSTPSSALTPGNAFEIPSISIRAVKASVPRPLCGHVHTLAGAQPSRKARAGVGMRPRGPKAVGGALLAMIRCASVGGRRRGVQIRGDLHPLRQLLVVLQVVGHDRVDVLADRRAKLDGGVRVARG